MTMKYISSVKSGVGRMTFVLAGAALVAAGLVAVTPAKAGATTVSCSYIGSGKYNCGFAASSPVRYSNNTSAGTLHVGNNWIKCQWNGGLETVGPYSDTWWAYTLSDQGHWGWVNAIYATSGTNYEPYGGGVPLCDQTVAYNGYGATGFPPGTKSSTSAKCSISLPSRVTAGQLIDPIISITNTGTESIAPPVSYRWFGTSNGQSMGSNYGDPLQFASIPAGHITKFHLESTSFTANQTSIADNFQWIAYSGMPDFSCNGITFP